MLLTAAGYLLAGKLALLLAIPPGYASPLYPSAGLALAAALVYGRVALPGVLMGAYLVQVLVAAPSGLHPPLAQLLSLVTAVGAMLQAALGVALVRWRLKGPLELAEPREVATFCLLAGAVACCLNASLSTLALSWAGVVPAGARAFNWWTWWVGDTLGVLIGAPILLTLIGRPQAAWATRRITLGLPLLIATVLLAVATVLVARWDTERTRSVFDRDASAAGAALTAELRQALFALEALRGLYVGSDNVTPEELHRVTQPWLQLPLHIQAMGYSERVSRQVIAEHQVAVTKRLGRPFRIFDRETAGIPSTSRGDADVVAITLIEPMAANQRALGVNVLSVPAAREALLRPAETDAPAATSGFQLSQESADQTGVVLYRALYDGEPEAAARRQALRGAVFVSLRMQQSMAAATRHAPAYLRWCLIDSQPAAIRPVLAGTAGCEVMAAGALRHDTALTLGGQHWVLHLGADPTQVPDAGPGNAWLFSTVGLLSAAML
ncbi:MAG: CHASE domain-containing protein, partial [Microbacteriaceae bacterium]|nr:CHASE domain-containing protein [Burkholderiaceae bacterium]